MTSKIDVKNLKGASETLLTTLYLRSLETKRQDGIIKDKKSVELVNKINYDFSKYDSQFSQAVIAIRSKVIDELVEKFVVENPKGTIVNLGAGLCTRFYRLDNGSINWISVDLPQVEPIWNTLIGPSARSQYLAYSVLDFAWIEKVKESTSADVLFVAEGLLMFLAESEVKQLINALQQNFPNSELVFDSLGIFLAQNSRLNSGKLEIKAAYQWGIKNLKEMEKWNKGINLAGQYYYFDRHKTRLGWFGLLSYFPGLRRQVKIGHLKFI